MIYTHVAAGIVAAALASWGTWHVQDWRLTDKVAAAKKEATQAKADLATEKQDRKDQLLRARASAMDTYIRMESTKNAAIKDQTKRADANRDLARQLQRDVDGLLGDLAAVPTRIATASREAVDDYAATATKLFGHCTREYAEMAARADGHATDAQALSEAWPTNQSQPDAGSTLEIIE